MLMQMQESTECSSLWHCTEEDAEIQPTEGYSDTAPPIPLLTRTLYVLLFDILITGQIFVIF